MNARVRCFRIILVLATVALFASIMPPPTGVKAQTVTTASQRLAPFPKPASLMSGVDKYCPYFFRSNITGQDRVDFLYYVDTTRTEDVSLLFTDMVIVVDKDVAPTVKPLDGSWKSAKHWELTLSQTVYGENRGCLPTPN